MSLPSYIINAWNRCSNIFYQFSLNPGFLTYWQNNLSSIWVWWIL